MKKATYYEAETPDGYKLIKKSFNITSDTAYIAAFKNNDKWHVSGVVDSPKDWGIQQFFPAKKLLSYRSKHTNINK